MDALRSHVAQAQARANHIVDEFQSMLLVTGPHSMKEVMHIQSQAGLAESTAPLPAAATAPGQSAFSAIDAASLQGFTPTCALYGLLLADGPQRDSLPAHLMAPAITCMSRLSFACDT